MNHFFIYLFHRCSYILGAQGKVIPFNDKQRESMTRNVIEPMASDGLRTLGLAYKDYIPNDQNIEANEVSVIKIILILE